MNIFKHALDVHVRSTHMESAGRQLQYLWRENARLTALSESEARHTAGGATSWIFNWGVNGWDGDPFNRSEEHSFGGGFKGCCSVIMPDSTDTPDYHMVVFMFTGEAECRVKAKFSILDKNDKTLDHIKEGPGGPHDPARIFKSTADVKALSIRTDGTFRMRAEIEIFPGCDYALRSAESDEE
jgi:hypothetical protein